MRYLGIITIAIGLFCMTYLPQAEATTTVTANLNVSAIVDSACQISTTALSFPTYRPIGDNATNPDDSTYGSVTVTCTTGVGSQILMGQGNNWTGSQARLHNTAGNSYLPYTIYQDASHTVVWDNSTGMTVAPAPDNTPRTISLYGRIPAGQNVASGTYTDVVSVSLLF